MKKFAAYLFLFVWVLVGCNELKQSNTLTIDESFTIKELTLKQTTPEAFLKTIKNFNIHFNEEFIERYENYSLSDTLYLCGNDERLDGTRRIYRNDSLDVAFIFKLHENKFLLKEYAIGDFSFVSFKTINPNQLSKAYYQKQANYFFDDSFEFSNDSIYRTVYYQTVDNHSLKTKAIKVQANF
ncbi:MAG: hypothetical protein ACI35V_12875 [Sphingobacterium composti]|uniref:hypothetical protein n=1 Tax=Sphingobacterium composti TaxID=363260 RepID=UPI00135CC8B0|nr:hypothetical protein [Sphingobacterium composti Ten et al. 2007 non Yoo et al. 2007]